MGCVMNKFNMEKWSSQKHIFPSQKVVGRLTLFNVQHGNQSHCFSYCTLAFKPNITVARPQAIKTRSCHCP
jgi:hypothetical protein